MGIEKLRVIETGLDPVTAEREQWDDGNNTLALAPGVVVAYERNVETNARLGDSGIEVLPIAASELGTGRGGPRCMSCPAARDPRLAAKSTFRRGSARRIQGSIATVVACGSDSSRLRTWAGLWKAEAFPGSVVELGGYFVEVVG